MPTIQTNYLATHARWVEGMELNMEPKVVVITDHYLPAYDDDSRRIIQITRDWVKDAGVGGFYPVTQAFLPYSNFSPFGFNGRFLYGRVSFDF